MSHSFCMSHIGCCRLACLTWKWTVWRRSCLVLWWWCHWSWWLCSTSLVAGISRSSASFCSSPTSSLSGKSVFSFSVKSKAASFSLTHKVGQFEGFVSAFRCVRNQIVVCFMTYWMSCNAWMMIIKWCQPEIWIHIGIISMHWPFNSPYIGETRLNLVSWSHSSIMSCFLS